MIVLERQGVFKLVGSPRSVCVTRLYTPLSRCAIRKASSDTHSKAPGVPPILYLKGNKYPTDSWTNVPSSIYSQLHRQLHRHQSHPIGLTRRIIESHFPKSLYARYDDLSPIVTVDQNFNSLGFPIDHPGRSKTDTYYINADTVLRTHTSAHQVDTFRKDESDGYTITADVYRRDAIDRNHYPIFHQMEGARLWDRRRFGHENIAKVVRADLEKLPKHDLQVEDPNPTVHEERNPLQAQYHNMEEVEAIATHLKRSLEGVVADILSKARQASLDAGLENVDAEEPLRVRWVEAYFPFTSPSWELEVLWKGEWLELLGCGIIKQNLLIDADVADRVGWAFGVGLERVAMLLFGIPDIRLFWSQDTRFNFQFTSTQEVRRFVPFSIHPACYKDVSFWLNDSSSSAEGDTINETREFHENDFMEIAREVAKGCIEDMKLVDSFTHPTTGRKSLCYRINYRSLDRTLTNAEANDLQQSIKERLVEELGVELR